jgi:hypothetical protein
VTASPALAVRAAVAVVALPLAWLAIVVATDGASGVKGAVGFAPADPSLRSEAPAAAWRAQIAKSPTDYVALVTLARMLERDGDGAGARAAMDEALKLAPADRQTLIEAAAFDLRRGDVRAAMTLLRRVSDLYPEAREAALPALAAGLDAGGQDAFFATVARDDPEWWPEFIAYACAKSRNADVLARLLIAHAQGRTVEAAEKRCVIGRLQREGRWDLAYQAWLDTLPPAQRQRVGYVYNGDFELPISNAGFDWTLPPVEHVSVEARPVAGGGGRAALRVEFARARWIEAPVRQYVMLVPGRYSFEGRGRSEGLGSWLGVQWGLYCVREGAGVPRQLARSGAFLAASAWEAWREAFEVPTDCPVQVLRLELANPRSDAKAPGDVTVRLDGVAWFDDFRIRSLD